MRYALTVLSMTRLRWSSTTLSHRPFVHGNDGTSLYAESCKVLKSLACEAGEARELGPIVLALLSWSSVCQSKRIFYKLV
eukprot:5672715-Amphidinium_carterae.1